MLNTCMFDTCFEDKSCPPCPIPDPDSGLGRLSSTKHLLTAIDFDVQRLISYTRQTPERLLRCMLGYRKRRSSLLLARKHRYEASGKRIGTHHNNNSTKFHIERHHVVSSPQKPIPLC